MGNLTLFQRTALESSVANLYELLTVLALSEYLFVYINRQVFKNKDHDSTDIPQKYKVSR